MSIDRITNSNQAQLMIAQINTANANLAQTEQQVSSGNVSNTYAGYGDQVQALEAANSAAARANAYKAAAQAGLNQANLQDTQLTQLSNLANQLRQDITTASANNDGSTLMTQVQGVFDQAVQILNTTDANGNYLFGGDKTNTPPVSVSSLSQLASATSGAAVFANGTMKSSVTVAEGQSVTVGVLASDVGSQLMQTIKDLVDYTTTNGALGSQMTSAQNSFLSGEIASAATAATTINTAAASNGDTYQQLQNAVTQQTTMNTLYQGFASNIQNVNMAQAITNLNQDQTALQAALQVTSQLGKLSLLNYFR
jgi:flagellar hook-associated protein 3 FlgL